MYKGAVFFDYDGTLSDERSGIYYPTPATCAAIDKLHSNGYLAILASGRMKSYAPQTDADFDGMISANGAYTFVGDKVIKECCFDTAVLRSITRACEDNGINYALECSERGYAYDMSDPHFFEVMDNFNIPRSIFVPLSGAELPGINKLIVTYADNSDADVLAEAVADTARVYPHRFCTSADVNLANVTKATGVAAITGYFGIDINETYAFGDGSNDLDMLKHVAHGIAMAQHAKCLEDAAEMITKSVAEEGISFALESYGLI